MPDLEKNKCLCTECEWIGYSHEVLKAQNPFDTKETIVGCPSCKSVESIVSVCDEKGCWRQVNCGFPTNKGYRNTCRDHYK